MVSGANLGRALLVLGKFHGLCSIYYDGYNSSSHTSITCEFINGIKYGAYRESYNSYAIHHLTECTYQDDILHGSYRYNREGIRILLCNYVNVKISGSYDENYNNGKPHIRCKYIDGLKQGEYMKFHENGMINIYCSNYTDNKVNGVYAIYDDTGDLKLEIQKRNGVTLRRAKLVPGWLRLPWSM